MIHNIKLWPDSFESIKNKTKAVKIRLNNEKRSLINSGDIMDRCKLEYMIKNFDFKEK